MRVNFDTHILINYLNDITQARGEFERYDQKYISIITFDPALPDVRIAYRM